MARNENMIAALKRERAGYVARGLDDRAALVDEQLAYYGEPVTVPEGRTSVESVQQTADAGAGEMADAPAKPRGKGGRPKLPRDAHGNIIRE